jgi:Tfp pilus assembly protein PilE
MRIIISLLLTVAIGMGTYVMYMKTAVSGTGGTPMSAVSTTTVKMQLLQIAQAERTYYVQNNSYATLDQLSSSGWLTMKTPDPTGYTYTVDATADGFTATARHPGAQGKDSDPKDFPPMSIDQTMKVGGAGN